MRKLLLLLGGAAGIVVLAVVAVVGVQLLRSDDPDLATEAPIIDTAGLDAQVGADEAADSSGAEGDTQLSEDVRHFVIVPAESEAKYVVRETLRGLETNAVGTTSAIEGDLYLTDNGLQDGEQSSFRVDLSTLESDEGRRDSFIKDNTLQTGQYQFAEFVIEDITGFPSDYQENTEVELSLSGTLTIRDISQPVTWTLLARQAGDTLTAVADTVITFQDFGMEPPSVTVAEAQDEIQLQVVLTAREAA